MRISSERLAALRARIRNAGGAAARGASRGGKGSAISALTGAMAYYAGNFAGDKIDFLKSHPLALPGAMALAGHFLKRKNHDAGTALIGAGGFAGAMAFSQMQLAQANKPTSGFDAGALINAGAYGEFEAGDLRDTSATSDTHGAGALIDASGPYDDAGDATEAMGL